jgi:polar amino acid transport system permease protein/cystine transport system permease protein
MEGLWAIVLAIPYTLLVTLGAFVVGFLLAIPLAFARRSKVAFSRVFSGLVIDLARGIPPIVWLLFIFFGLPLLKIRMNPLEAGILGLGVVSAGYLAEIFRGGLLAVPRGQFEACQALGLGPWTSFAEVISPQALKAMLPGLATYFIGLIKDSSIASVIGVTEMVYTATTYARNSADGIYTFFVAAAVYIVLSVPFGLLSRGMESRMKVSAR